MTQAELITAIQEKVRENDGREVAKADVEAVIKNFGAIVLEACQEEGAVTFPGVGKFTGKKQPARTRRNPATGGTVDVPEKVVGKFTFGSAAKRTINAD